VAALKYLAALLEGLNEMNTAVV